jgi:hypothetical protein
LISSCIILAARHYHLVARDLFTAMKNVARLVVAVNVARYKIEWHVLLRRVLNHRRNPCRLRGRWPTDAQARAHGFDVTRGVVIQLEVRFLLRDSRPEVEVGLVPDFEVPVGDLVYAVALDQVLSELSDQVIPLGVVLGRRDIRVIPERVQIRPGGKL